jgi:K+-sensing histidine kinase KdpD
MPAINLRDLGRLLAVAVPSLAGATLAIALLQGAGVPNASAVFLAALVAIAVVAGTWGAIVAAVA